MKIWLRRLCLVLLLFLSDAAQAKQWEWQDGVFAQRIGSNYIFVFPVTKAGAPAGRVTIGKTITILYSLRIIGGRARFIGIDASKAPKDMPSPQVKMQGMADPFGFIVKDAKQPRLDIHLSPEFAEKIKKIESATEIGRAISKQGNLDVLIGQDSNGNYVIIGVILS